MNRGKPILGALFGLASSGAFVLALGFLAAAGWWLFATGWGWWPW